MHSVSPMYMHKLMKYSGAIVPLNGPPMCRIYRTLNTFVPYIVVPLFVLVIVTGTHPFLFIIYVSKWSAFSIIKIDFTQIQTKFKT